MRFAAELAAEFISRPQNQEVVEGQKAEFTCSVSKESYSVKWMKDNKELEEGEKYQMVSDGKRRSLVIKNCEPKDEGGYVVVIGATRASADLMVQGKPRLIKKNDIIINLLSFFCILKLSLHLYCGLTAAQFSDLYRETEGHHSSKGHRR